MFRRTGATLLLATAIAGFVAPMSAAAAEPTTAPGAQLETCDATSTKGGAAGLVAAVVQAAVNACDVHILNDSVNDLLQNADIHVLENILNNSPVLSNNDITVQDINVDVLTGTTTITLLGGSVIVLQ